MLKDYCQLQTLELIEVHFVKHVCTGSGCNFITQYCHLQADSCTAPGEVCLCGCFCDNRTSSWQNESLAEIENLTVKNHWIGTFLPWTFGCDVWSQYTVNPSLFRSCSTKPNKKKRWKRMFSPTAGILFYNSNIHLLQNVILQRASSGHLDIVYSVVTTPPHPHPHFQTIPFELDWNCLYVFITSPEPTRATGVHGVMYSPTLSGGV